MKKIILSLLIYNPVIFGNAVLGGNAGTSTETFNFPIDSFIFNIPTASLFVGAASGATNTGNYTVAYLPRAGNSFMGITPPTVTLNDTENQANPLYNTSVTQLALTGASPIVTTTTNVTEFSVIQNYTNSANTIVLSTGALNDANGAVTSGVLALASNTVIPPTTTPVPPSYILAFVAPHGSDGAFGAAGSGIAEAVLQKEANSDQYTLSVLDTTTGTAGDLAYPVDISTTTLYINHALNSLTNPILYFDQYTNLFFAGFKATASAAGGDGARGVLRITSYPAIQLGAIAPTAAIGADSIIGTSTPSGVVTILDLKTMLTSTNLEYLIVRGGTSGSSNKIYAIPIINVAGTNYGTLADVTSLPVDVFTANPPYLFQGRTYVTPATSSDQLYTSNSVPAFIGGAAVPEDVTSILVKNDAIIAATNSGAYVSQAIFDIYGRIAQWTPWARTTGTVNSIFNIAIEQETGDYLYSTTANSGSTIVRTGWNKNNIISSALEPLFSQKQAGIQGFFDFTNVAVSDGGSGTAASCCITTGYNQVSLVQTGQTISSQLVPLTSIGSPFISTDGTLTGFTSAQQIAVSGGALASLQAIISAAIVQNGSQAWLFVGGNGGLAVLANDDGSGFNSTTGIGNNLSNLQSTMKFRQVGNYANIRKLIAFNAHGSDSVQDLYVLTSNSLERASISPAILAVGGTWNSTVLATSAEQVGKYGSLSDCLISAPLALLATSKGLLRSGNTVDISLATQPSTVNWTAVYMPESPGPVTRLLPISPTAQASGFTSGGNVYALAAAVSTSQARIYRYVTTITDSVVTDTTVQLFPDYFVAEPTNHTEGRQSFFMSVGNYRNYFYTNGANYYFMRSAYLQQPPFINLILQQVLTGVTGLGAQQSPVFIPVGCRAMGQLTPLSSTGGLCAYGDFGLQINE